MTLASIVSLASTLLIAVAEEPDEEDSDEAYFAYRNFSGNSSNASRITDDYNEMMAYIYPSPTDWMLIGLHFVVFTVGLGGNFLVCMAIYRNHTMRTVTNYFIVNLAVADLLVMLFCQPITVLWDITETWFLGRDLCKVIPYLQTVSVSVSVLTLTFISIDRWYAICFPLRFKSTTGRAKTAIIIIWILSFLLDVPELLVLHTVPYHKAPKGVILFTQCTHDWSMDTQIVYVTVKFFLLYTSPLLFMSIAYFQIIRVLWRNDIPGHSLSTRIGQMNEIPHVGMGNPEGQLRSRRKAAKMLVAVVVTFAICYFPVHLLEILRRCFLIPSNEVVNSMSLVAHWLCYLNSAVNPLIYNFMSGKFRQEFKRTFRCERGHSGRTSGAYNLVGASCRTATLRSRTAATRSIHTLTNNNNHIQRSTEVIPLSTIMNASVQNEKSG